MGSVVDDWTTSASSAESCPGASAADYMPFAFEGAASTVTGQLTNAELYAFFDPANDLLPYVYDSFEFSS